ncbi:MAG TPA: hypothetical protein VKW78_00505 [Terriglobales bacterium]|nr:hypothetical protein [Terriglobales bacterium]
MPYETGERPCVLNLGCGKERVAGAVSVDISSAVTPDVVHNLNHFTENSYNDFYSECRFRLQTRKLLFYPSLINKFVRRRAERNPQRFEKSWTWALPAWYLYFELVVVKPGVHAPAAPKAEAYVQH